MNRCERESEVVAALRAGSWTDALSSHVSSCASCAETERVARALLESAAALGSELPSPDAMWRQGQARMQAIALKRATRPLIVMRTLSLACMAAFAAWTGWEFWRFPAGYLHGMDNWMAAGTPSIEAGVAVAVSLIAVGAGYLLHAGRHDGDVMPSA